MIFLDSSCEQENNPVIPLEPRYLLVVTCSQRKSNSPGLLPAIDRYNGINYLIIRKAKREKYLSKNLDLLIISAKYGIIEPDTEIEYYDLKMTKNLAKKMREFLAPKLAEKVKSTKYNEIFLNIGEVYKMAIDGWDSDNELDSSIIYASGGIGKRSSQMLQWLLKIEKKDNSHV